MHRERRRAGLFSINVRVGKILTVHREGGLNLSLKTIGSGDFYHLFVQKIRKCEETFSSRIPKILRNFYPYFLKIFLIKKMSLLQLSI